MPGTTLTDAVNLQHISYLITQHITKPADVAKLMMILSHQVSTLDPEFAARINLCWGEQLDKEAR